MKKTISGVPRAFDDQLEALVTFIGQNNWTITGVDLSELQADLVQQRGDRQRDLDLARQASSFRLTFLTGQAERYARYIKALAVLRAAHRDNRDVQKALSQFKRQSRRAAPVPSNTASPTDESKAA